MKGANKLLDWKFAGFGDIEHLENLLHLVFVIVDILEAVAKIYELVEA